MKRAISIFLFFLIAHSALFAGNATYSINYEGQGPQLEDLTRWKDSGHSFLKLYVSLHDESIQNSQGYYNYSFINYDYVNGTINTRIMVSHHTRDNDLGIDHDSVIVLDRDYKDDYKLKCEPFTFAIWEREKVDDEHFLLKNYITGGYISHNGINLTITDNRKEAGIFTISLETLSLHTSSNPAEYYVGKPAKDGSIRVSPKSSHYSFAAIESSFNPDALYNPESTDKIYTDANGNRYLIKWKYDCPLLYSLSTSTSKLVSPDALFSKNFNLTYTGKTVSQEKEEQAAAAAAAAAAAKKRAEEALAAMKRAEEMAAKAAKEEARQKKIDSFAAEYEVQKKNNGINFENGVLKSFTKVCPDGSKCVVTHDEGNKYDVEIRTSDSYKLEFTGGGDSFMNYKTKDLYGLDSYDDYPGILDEVKNYIYYSPVITSPDGMKIWILNDVLHGDYPKVKIYNKAGGYVTYRYTSVDDVRIDKTVTRDAVEISFISEGNKVNLMADWIWVNVDYADGSTIKNGKCKIRSTYGALVNNFPKSFIDNPSLSDVVLVSAQRKYADKVEVYKDGKIDEWDSVEETQRLKDQIAQEKENKEYEASLIRKYGQTNWNRMLKGEVFIGLQEELFLIGVSTNHYYVNIEIAYQSGTTTAYDVYQKMTGNYLGRCYFHNKVLTSKY